MSNPAHTVYLDTSTTINAERIRRRLSPWVCHFQSPFISAQTVGML